MQKALYRAHRPQTFDEVVGQEAIVTALKNQVKSGRIGHAYLFAGTRGTGKTSCAKIFARAVNCLHPKDGSPCNACENCRAVLEETTMDVVEMDAASNRRIDDIRELRDTVKYPPTKLRYKVYIIDEAHMITTEAFNALLKIMEEPPEHLIFILATTEPEKIPQTILSRVQRYEFKRIPVELIGERIRQVASDAGVRLDDAACEAIALSADGAMRDALSLLDQVIAMGEEEITADVVERVLGTAGFQAFAPLIDALVHERMSEAYQVAWSLLRAGREPQVLLRELTDAYRRLMLVKGAGDAISLPLSEPERATYRAWAHDVAMSRLLDGVDLLIDAETRIRKSEAAEALFLAVVGRLVDATSPHALESRVAALEEKLAAIGRWQSPERVWQDDIAREVTAQWERHGAVTHAAMSDVPKAPVGSSANVAQKSRPEADASRVAASPRAVENTPPAAAASGAVVTPSSAEVETASPAAVSSAKVETASSAAVSSAKVEKTPPASVERATSARRETEAPEHDVNPDFHRDPESFLQLHRDEWRHRVAKAKIVVPALLGRYESIEVRGQHVTFFYPPNEVTAQVLGNKEEALSRELSALVGETLTVHIAKPGAHQMMMFEETSFAHDPHAGQTRDAVARMEEEKGSASLEATPPQESGTSDLWAKLQAAIPPELLSKEE